MLFTALISIIWVIWTAYVMITGASMYEGTHAHTYAYCFFAGLISIMAASLYLKVIQFWNKPTRWTSIGFGLWLFGLFLFFVSMIFGAPEPAAHVLKQHILFNHVNFMLFLLGLMVSVYNDTLVVSRLAVHTKDLHLHHADEDA